MSELFITRVVKRDGSIESFDSEELSNRIRGMCFGLNQDFILVSEVVRKVQEGLAIYMHSQEIDILLAEVCASLVTKHPDYALLAGRIAISNLHKRTRDKYSDLVKDLYHHRDPFNGEQAPLISNTVYNVVVNNKRLIDEAIRMDEDFEITYFGFKTLEKSYLLKLDGKVVERPQYMFMRVALGIHGENLDDVLETYELMSGRYFIHASPTLFNAGTPKGQLCSCFLMAFQEDSVERVYDVLKQSALISKGASGIGIGLHPIRATGSLIRGIHGHSNGLVPMVRLFNETARFITQGGSKRPSSFTVYLEPWHADLLDYLNLKKNNGKEEQRARDLYYGLWIPDLFMERVERDDYWTLVSPDECPGLDKVWGPEFNALYEKYENAGLGRLKMKARKLWEEICSAQTETGMPYLMYKDSCNGKSNHQHLGTITTSNPCAELIQYIGKDEISTCNVGSIAVNMCVRDDMTYDFDKLEHIASVITKNLDRIIDVNNYPTAEAKLGGLRHRSLGVGVQGLSDVFLLMQMAYDSQEAGELNKLIFETIYYSCLKTSCRLAEKHGPYPTFAGSPMSRGILQMDFWDTKVSNERYDWDSLREEIKKHGLRNSHLTALMPTASTSQILGNCECFEPYTNNIFARRVFSGEYQVANPHLVKQLIELNLWDDCMRQEIIANNGSIQGIEEIPAKTKVMFKTVWELSQKTIIDMAADRSPFIDQSQSMNLFLGEPTFQKLCSMHFYSWKKGLKTGSYYLRMRPATNAIQFTIDKTKLTNSRKANDKKILRPSSTTIGCQRSETTVEETAEEGREELEDVDEAALPGFVVVSEFRKHAERLSEQSGSTSNLGVASAVFSLSPGQQEQQLDSISSCDDGRCNDYIGKTITTNNNNINNDHDNNDNNDNYDNDDVHLIPFREYICLN